MNDSSPNNFAIETQIDSICDAFEKALRDGESPELINFVDQLPDTQTQEHRRRLATELILLELDYRINRGDSPSIEEYDLPSELQRAVADAFRHIGRLNKAAQDTPSSEMATLAASENAATAIGERIHYFGDYELIDEIARGGMGVVYKAKQISLSRTIALKMILSGQLADDNEVRRFRLEAEAAANLDHPNIVPIYDIGDHNGQHYFTMKLIEGCTLTDFSPDLRGNYNQIVELVAKIADAIHHAHQRGILHRDLKPGNVLIDTDQQPLVTDFGLARKLESDRGVTQTGAVVGTPGFMSPEQASGKGVTTATDIYSIGAILYELLCGRPPHAKESVLDTLMSVINDEPERLRNYDPSVPPDLELIALKCLEKDPNKRYTSTAEIANDLRAFAKGEPLMVRAPSIVEVARMWLGANFGNVLWVPIIALLVGVCVGVGIWLMAYGDRSSNWDTVYANFPPVHRPTIPFRLIHWIDDFALPMLFLIMTSLGWATARLVQTKNTTADWSVGLAVGLLAGLIAFICGAGAPLIDSQTSLDDLQLLFELAGSPGSSVPLENLLKRYPDLKGLTRYNQAALLSDKISIDQSWILTGGIWFGSLFCLTLLGVTGAVGTRVAGPLVRQRRWISGLTSYLCFALALNAIGLLVFSEVWIHFIAGAGLILNWIPPLLCVLFALLAITSVLRQWPWYLKSLATVLWLGFYSLFAFQTYATETSSKYSVAEKRGAIKAARKIVEMNPDDRVSRLDLAQAHFDFAMALHERKYNERALRQFEESFEVLSRSGEPAEFNIKEQGLYSAYLYWSALGAFELGQAKVAADRMLEHIRFFPYSSRWVLKLYAESVLSLDASIEVADYVIPGEKASAEGWRVTINQINALCQTRQRQQNSSSEPTVDPWRQFVVDQVLKRARGTEEPENWMPREKKLRQWMNSTQSWTVWGPIKIASEANHPAILNQQFEAEPNLLQDYGNVKEASLVKLFAQTQLDFTKVFETKEDAVAYAGTIIQLPEDQVVTFRLGADDLHRLWIDGTPAHENLGVVGIEQGRQKFEIALNAGEHRLLMKVTQGVGEWGFVIDAADSGGWPIPIWHQQSND
ncbi:serine/threonine-protein kinase [Planctomycetaceae bacterium SH139]